VSFALERSVTLVRDQLALASSSCTLWSLKTYATDSLKATAISLAMSSEHVTYAATTAERHRRDGYVLISLLIW